MKGLLLLFVAILCAGCALPVTVNGKVVTGNAAAAAPERNPFYGTWR